MAGAFSPQRNWFCPWLPHSKSKVCVKLFALTEGFFFFFFLKITILLLVYEIHLPAEKEFKLTQKCHPFLLNKGKNRSILMDAVLKPFWFYSM